MKSRTPATLLLAAMAAGSCLSAAPASAAPAAAARPTHCQGHKITVFGTSGADRLLGTPRNDVIWGGAGNDVLDGRGGNDVLCGDLGNDTLLGGPGRDALYGGGGNDLLQGQSGNDHLHGQDGDDRLDGGTGNDTVLGGAGNDRLRGGSGNDRLDGGAGRNTAFAGGGSDQVTLRPGDTLADKTRGTVVFRAPAVAAPKGPLPPVTRPDPTVVPPLPGPPAPPVVVPVPSTPTPTPTTSPTPAPAQPQVEPAPVPVKRVTAVEVLTTTAVQTADLLHYAITLRATYDDGTTTTLTRPSPQASIRFLQPETGGPVLADRTAPVPSAEPSFAYRALRIGSAGIVGTIDGVDSAPKVVQVTTAQITGVRFAEQSATSAALGRTVTVPVAAFTRSDDAPELPYDSTGLSWIPDDGPSLFDAPELNQPVADLNSPVDYTFRARATGTQTWALFAGTEVLTTTTMTALPAEFDDNGAAVVPGFLAKGNGGQYAFGRLLSDGSTGPLVPGDVLTVTSSDPAVLGLTEGVDSDGNPARTYEALTPGTATMTVTLALEGGAVFQRSFPVEVGPAVAVGADLVGVPQNVELGDTFVLTARVVMSDGTDRAFSTEDDPEWSLTSGEASLQVIGPGALQVTATTAAGFGLRLSSSVGGSDAFVTVLSPVVSAAFSQPFTPPALHRISKPVTLPGVTLTRVNGDTFTFDPATMGGNGAFTLADVDDAPSTATLSTAGVFSPANASATETVRLTWRNQVLLSQPLTVDTNPIVTLTASNFNLFQGQRAELYATAGTAQEEYYVADNSRLDLVSGNTAVFEVNRAGELLAIGAGSAMLTITFGEVVHQRLVNVN